MVYVTTTTHNEAMMAEAQWCSICKNRGHTAKHHKAMPDVYGKIKNE